MAERKPLFVAGRDAGTGEDLRLLNAAILGGAAFTPITPGVGAIAKGHGVLSGSSFLVTPTSPTPNSIVHVAAGHAAIKGTQNTAQGTYVVSHSNVTDITITSKHATLPRFDYVVAQVRDGAYATFSEDDDLITVVEGTPGGGNPSIPHDCLPLALVTIQAGIGSTDITANDIQDLRPHARGSGGITPFNSRNDVPSPQTYEFIWEYSTQTLLMWDGTAWKSHGTNLSAEWVTTFSPVLGGVTLGANGTKYCRYTKLGKMVSGIMGWDLNGTGAVNGVLAFTLPFPSKVFAGGHSPIGGRAKIGSSYWSFTGDIPSSDPQRIRSLATSGSTAWAPGIPTTWTNTSSLDLFFTYECA